MKIVLGFLTAIMACGFLAQAGTVRVVAQDQVYTVSVKDKGGVPNDEEDDGPAFRAALAQVGTGGEGGTVFVPPGRWVISTPVRAEELTGKSVRFLGTGGDSVIVVKTPGEITFYLANAETVLFEGLTFVSGDLSAVSDAGNVIRVDGARSATIKDTNFYGISSYGGVNPANASTVWFFNSGGVLERVGFYGSASQSSAVVLYSSFASVSVRNVHFLDYGTHAGVFYSKTPLVGLTNAWLEVRDPAVSAQTASTNASAVDVQNFTGDEGSLYQVMLNPSAGGEGRRIHSARLFNVKGNVANIVGAGVYALGVDALDIEHSWFGYAPNSTAGIKTYDCGKVTLNAVRFAQGVDRYEIGSTNNYVEIIASSPSAIACSAQNCKTAVSYGDLATAGNLDGNGVAGKLARWQGTKALASSSISDDGTNVTIANPGALNLNNSGPVNFGSTGGAKFSSNISIPIVSVSFDFILTPAHSVVLVNASAGRRLIYLPAASANKGSVYTIKKMDSTANTVLIESRTFSQGMANVENLPYYEFKTPLQSVTVISDGTNWWIIR
ncbi:MAG TPA: glycosyl hydrolase family 28-related protein [Pyrinomonadaceae bacterium]|nr:glycosyl hydrolase family 28-related protein [Pyrinomonadaceae bacterium]